jgi:hypothetical protein
VLAQRAGCGCRHIDVANNSFVLLLHSHPCIHVCSRSVALLERAQSEVVADGIAQLIAAALRDAGHSPVSRLVLLGVGSPTSSAPARYQLALALALLKALAVESARLTPHSCCRMLSSLTEQVTDGHAHFCQARHWFSTRRLTRRTPHCSYAAASACWTPPGLNRRAHAAYVVHCQPWLSLLVMQRWQAHAAPLGEHTLFFMPHCEQFLYEAVLAASLRGSGLAHAAILGNSFAEYEERAALLRSASDPDASCLSRLQPYIQGAPRTRLATSSVPL